jgi:sporulation protein YlmC with PRC-barrel domain
MPNNGPPHERVPSMAVDDEQSESAMTDPVSWLQIEQGWNVITSDGVIVGTVAQVEGDKQSDIFDGLAVESKQPTQIRYVPGEQVAAIYPGEVTLKIASANRDARAVSCAASRDEVASGKGASRDSDVELATGKTLEHRRVASALW